MTACSEAQIIPLSNDFETIKSLTARFTLAVFQYKLVRSQDQRLVLVYLLSTQILPCLRHQLLEQWQSLDDSSKQMLHQSMVVQSIEYNFLVHLLQSPHPVRAASAEHFVR